MVECSFALRYTYSALTCVLYRAKIVKFQRQVSVKTP